MISKKTIGNAIITSAIGIILYRTKTKKLIYLDKLPLFVNTFIKAHFASHRILKVVRERDGFSRTYQVYLDGGLKLELNRKGNAINIEGISKLPDSVIPQKIIVFISTYYSRNTIISWKRKNKTQEVNLDSGLVLVFDLNGESIQVH